VELYFQSPIRFHGIVRCEDKFIFAIFIGVFNEEIFIYNHRQNPSIKKNGKKEVSDLIVFFCWTEFVVSSSSHSNFMTLRLLWLMTAAADTQKLSGNSLMLGF
jgi:hypothetical protein